MLVVVAEKLPPAVRGKLKLWTIEPIPHVFVSSVADALAEEVAKKLFESCNDDSSMLIIRSQRKSPGYVIQQKIGEQAQEKIIKMTGLQLVKQMSAVSNSISAKSDGNGKKNGV